MFAGLLIAGLLSSAHAEVQAADPFAVAISEAVRAHVALTAGVDSADVELRWLGLGATIQCPADAQVLVDTRPGENFRGRTDLRITMLSGQEQCARLRLPSRIAIWQSVQIAAADAAPGTPVQMVSGRASRDSIRGEPIDPSHGPWLAVHTIRAGAAVTSTDVLRAPTVLAGDPVQLQAVFGGLQIKADAHMLNDANIGERVRVANNATGGVVSGVLVDARTVRVGEPR